MKTQSEFLFGDLLWAYMKCQWAIKQHVAGELPSLYAEVEAEKSEEAGSSVWENNNEWDRYYE